MLLALALTASSACGGAEATPAVSAETRAAYRSVLVDRADCRKRGPALVSPEDMRGDIEVVERVLRRGYAGYELAGSDEAWAEVFRGMRQSVADAAIPPRAFRDQLIEHLRFADDNHLALVTVSAAGERSWRSTSGHGQAYYGDVVFHSQQDGDGDGGPAAFVDDEGRRLVGCGELAPADVLRPVLGAAPPRLGYRIVRLTDTPVAALRCTFADGAGEESERDVPMSRVDIGDGRGPVYERRDEASGDVPWLRLRSLAASHGGALERFVASAPVLRDEPVVILDVRRQAGGSDRYLLRWFKELTSEDIPYFHTRTLESEVTLQGALNFWGCIAEGNTRADEGGTTWLERRVARAERELEEAMTRRGTFREFTMKDDPIRGRAPRPFAGRLLVVVDRGCASACETTVLIARHFPSALIVGENTEGTMKVGELRSYRLPASGIYMTAGHRVHEDPQEPNIFPEGVGYQPDLWLVGDDAEAQIRSIATCLRDASCARGLDEALGLSRSR